MTPEVYELRSAGISVVPSHVPLAYLKKSSPGTTDRSIPATSIPGDGDVAEVLAGEVCPAATNGRTGSAATATAKSRLKHGAQAVHAILGLVASRAKHKGSATILSLDRGAAATHDERFALTTS